MARSKPKRQAPASAPPCRDDDLPTVRIHISGMGSEEEILEEGLSDEVQPTHQPSWDVPRKSDDN